LSRRQTFPWPVKVPQVFHSTSSRRPLPAPAAHLTAISLSYLLPYYRFLHYTGAVHPPSPPLPSSLTATFSPGGSARIRSPKIIRNRFETRPFESWSSCRSSGGAAEGRGTVGRFLLPLLSYPTGTFLSRGRPPEGMDLFNCFIISTARHGARYGGVASLKPPSFRPLPRISSYFVRSLGRGQGRLFPRVYSIYIYIFRCERRKALIEARRSRILLELKI